jgi:type II secretory pathway pseudopilin PulG
VPIKVDESLLLYRPQVLAWVFSCVPERIRAFSNKEGLELPLPVRRQAGFSLTELLVALLVAMILLAVSLPMFLRAYHSYQLSNAAQQVADILRLTRYEAIRVNQNVSCTISTTTTPPGMSALPAGMTGLWMAASRPGVTVNPVVVLLGNSGNLVGGGAVPGASTMLSQAVGTAPTTAPSPSNSAIWFDSRGAITTPSVSNVNVFYLASALAPEAGYRAVLLMPAGAMQIWTADSSGNWQEQR